MARVLLIGSKGWIGGKLLTILQTVPGIAEVIQSNIRADDIDSVKCELDTLQPTHVISAIGRLRGVVDDKIVNTADYLEYPGKWVENIRDNLFAPIVIAKLCSDRNIHFTYIGTGCIFENTENIHSFNETAKPNFFGASYSITKGFTDQLMSLYSDNVLNVRIRMPISAESGPREFITKIVKYEKICSMPNSMTVLDELLPIMVDMVLKKRTGTINLTNPGTITHEEILEIYKELIEPTKTWTLMTCEEQSKILKSRRSNNMLDTSKLMEWYPEVSDIRTAVRTAVEKRAST